MYGGFAELENSASQVFSNALLVNVGSKQYVVR